MSWCGPIGRSQGRGLPPYGALFTNSPAVVVAPIRAILEPVLEPEELKKYYVDLRVGDEVDLKHSRAS